MLAHRIGSKRFCGTALDAFSGRGSLHGHGRWHHRGRLAVYVASHESLALLEILVHLNRKTDLQPMVHWTVEIPDEVIEDEPKLAPDWAGNPEYTRQLGDSWLASGRAPALRVPSAIVRSEHNLLLNPAHPDFDLQWVRSGPVPIKIDDRLL